MAKKSKLLKDFKTVKKTAGKSILTSAESGVAFVAFKGISNIVAAKITNPNMQKAVGPAVAVAGMAIEAFSDNSHLSAVGRGMTIAGFDRTADTFIPEEVKAKIGLSGVAATKRTVEDRNQYLEEMRRRADEAVRLMNENAAPGSDGPMNGVDNEVSYVNMY